MTKRSFNRVRMHRSHWALSVSDLGLLLGRDPSMVSRIERSGTPSTRALIGCEVVFGAGARLLFPGRYEQVEDAVMRRAAKLLESLDGKTDKRSQRKRELLADMMRRATANTPEA